MYLNAGILWLKSGKRNTVNCFVERTEAVSRFSMQFRFLTNLTGECIIVSHRGWDNCDYKLL